MYPLVTQKTTLPETQRKSLPGTLRVATLVTARATTPGNPKTPGTPRYSTLRDIERLSPGIESSTNSVTPERITPQKR